MNLLLDTHTFLWFFDGKTLLSNKAKKAIENTENN
jgi:PIN domain nuclease of toxin-antitoxin system